MLAAEALKQSAQSAGHELQIELRLQNGAWQRVADAEIAKADVVIVASDEQQDFNRFRGKKMIEVPISRVILETGAVIGKAVTPVAESQQDRLENRADEYADETTRVRIVAVTACPTGIAHTFMAAEALRKSAAKLGYAIKVETQGSVGAKNFLTGEEIRYADVVIVAADTYVDTARFAGKRVCRISTKDALREGTRVIENALAMPEPTQGTDSAAAGERHVLRLKPQKGMGPYQHLMTGVSYMLPLVTAGGLLIALSFAIGGTQVSDHPNTLGWALMQIGAGTAFRLYVPVLAAFIAYSIADRPGLAPGLVGGMLATTLGAGFLGGIIAGFLAGYVTRLLNDTIKLPENLAGLKPVVILPVISTLLVGLAMIFLIGVPTHALLGRLTAWLNGMQQSSAIALGLLLGAMMAVDMGGPINKAAYTFSVALLASKVYQPMAATMAAGMTPPLGIALATVLLPNRFSEDERNAGKATAVLGLSFITEGAIPYAAKDPFRVIPCLVAGSASAGALSMAFGVRLMVPHGGFFALFIPHAVEPLGLYLLALFIGTAVTVVALSLTKQSEAKIEMKLNTAITNHGRHIHQRSGDKGS